MSEFDGIANLADWKAKLAELLAEAKKAAGANDDKALTAIADRLTEFTIESWPDTPEIKALDGIAADTATMLRKQGIEGKLDSLGARTAELEQVAASFDQAANANTDKAASIRLKRVREVVDTATSTVTTLTRFRQTLKTGDDAALIVEVNGIVDALNALMKKVDVKA
jgi:hypothetical protein